MKEDTLSPSNLLSEQQQDGDIALLSALFPPPTNRLRVSTYSIGYLQSLEKRRELCSMVSYYLADRVIDTFVQVHPHLKEKYASKRDWKVTLAAGVTLLQLKLTTPM